MMYKLHCDKKISEFFEKKMPQEFSCFSYLMEYLPSSSMAIGMLHMIIHDSRMPRDHRRKIAGMARHEPCMNHRRFFRNGQPVLTVNILNIYSLAAFQKFTNTHYKTLQKRNPHTTAKILICNSIAALLK